MFKWIRNWFYRRHQALRLKMYTQATKDIGYGIWWDLGVSVGGQPSSAYLHKRFTEEQYQLARQTLTSALAWLDYHQSHADPANGERLAGKGML